jgi:predicted P-loop ATPase
MESRSLIALARKDADAVLGPDGKKKEKPDAYQRTDADDKPKAVGLAAVARILREPPWADVLAYNERTTEMIFTGEPPCLTAHKSFPAPIVDPDFTSVVEWFNNQCNLNAPYTSVEKGVYRAATLASFDPVRDYLEKLEWDETDRLRDWLACYFGADDDDWTQAIGSRWLISAVARVYSPGCQADSILIAEGPQGIGKSSAFRALVPNDDWFACDLPDIKHKDAVHHLLGPWIVELSELDALSRKEATAIKSFVSCRVDRARLSYGRVSTNHKRRVVFCGSTNEDAWNTDATGGRRYWPFKVRDAIDVGALTRDRDQLWAEAVHRYKAGELWHLDDAKLVGLAESEQRQRFKASTWLEPIEQYALQKLAEPGYVTIAGVLADVMEMELGHQDQRSQNEAARCLQHLGWHRVQKRIGLPGKKRRQWVYEPSPDTTTEPVSGRASGDR